MIQTIFWDLGGVIVKDNIIPAFHELGIPYTEQAKEFWKLHRVGKINQGEYFRQVLEGTPYVSQREKLRRRTEELLELQPEGALPVVEYLQSTGKYKQGVISNHSKEWGRKIVEKFSLEKLLSPIFISAEVGMDKSGVKLFQYACRAVRSSPEQTLFVDNQENNVAMAWSAGLHAVLFENKEKLKEDLGRYDVVVR